MKVYVDNRETEKRKEKAKKIFKNIEIKKLSCGDYVCGNTAIEFKKDDVNDAKAYINKIEETRMATAITATKAIKPM